MKKLLFVLIATGFATKAAFADPWVDTSNVFLRANIQVLADAGIIKTPVTTFPLMWHDINKDLNNVYLSQLSPKTKEAFLYVRHQLKLAKRNSKLITVNVASDDKRFTSFGDEYRDANNIKVATSFKSERFAFKVSTSYNPSPIDEDKTRFDDSYGAFFLGNWVFSAGMQQRWWGPGIDTSLILSNNARPMPALTLSRKSSEPFTIPWTDIDIPWTVTTFMAKMDDKRVVKDTLLWGFRLNFKPTQNLEIGVSRLAQWAGEGRPKNFSTFVDVLKGLDNCGGNGPSVEECAAGKEPGNQLAGYDIRYSNTIFDHPFALYFITHAEDGDRKGGLSILGEEKYQMGIETQLHAFGYNWKLYLESTDTYALCSDGVNGDGTSRIGNCYYEHHIYKTGLRYNKRSIANLYDNDATSLVLGASTLSAGDTQIETKLRWLQLNKDNADKAPENPIIGNPLTSIAEDMFMVSSKVQHSYKNWRFTIGSDISRSTFDNAVKDQTDVNVFAQVEYNL
ncbi:capsule assembly Wzi family protein [Thalassotalea marina]|uniref:Outer membrane protein in capsule/EPS biosynthesis locus n=1 Tax=Thalassotalea marina TaxID=1673741 RepID=A0A919BE07_9GAMM|nr:capsule assembly Wzi family protein [Thalassotalea marina]GHF85125.1 outer membrane protein in capsule/EPS biosynthesis locus [Thalassotalea marina]